MEELKWIEKASIKKNFPDNVTIKIKEHKLFAILTNEKKFYLKEFEAFMSSRVGDHRDWSNAEKHKNTNQDQVARRMPFLKNYLKDRMQKLHEKYLLLHLFLLPEP